MNHPPRRHLSGARRHRLAELDRCERVALVLNHPAACAHDRPGDAATVPQVGVGSVRDRVDVELGYVRLLDLDLGHRDPGAASCVLLLCALGGR